MIVAKDLRRTFTSTQKEEGTAGALKLLLKPKIQTHEALKGVTFQIAAGEFVGLIGANGAGKTTLLKILTGLIPPTSGEVQVLGETPFKRSLNFRKQIALVMGQKAQLWWDLPALDAFDLIRAIYRIPATEYRARLHELTELLDVGRLLQTQIRRLSLGERMKMELIGALLHWPRVIFLDEPTIGLDVFAAQKLREFLHEFNQKRGATIILTSHNMEDIERLCPRIMLIQEGAFIYDGAPAKLIRSDLQRLKLKFARKISPEELSRMVAVATDRIQVEVDPEDPDSTGRLCIELERSKIPETLKEIVLREPLIEMTLEEPSLETVIQKLYSKGK